MAVRDTSIRAHEGGALDERRDFGLLPHGSGAGAARQDMGPA